MAPMIDVILRTNSDNPSLTLRSCHRLGSDFGCLLSLRSGPFSADVDFYFEGHALLQFVDDMRGIDTSLRGKARLKLDFEDPFLELEGDGRGHVHVRGLLVQTGDVSQRMEFHFRTDQTCLRPFIDDLEHLTSETAI
jgi:hypothetical protein